jgi:uncharacterized membrane protein
MLIVHTHAFTAQPGGHQNKQREENNMVSNADINVLPGRRDRIALAAPPLGRYAMALGMLGLGILSLIHGDFALQWQPVPDGIPGRTPLAYASGLILAATGLGMFFRRTVLPGAAVLACFVALWVLALQLPKVVAGDPGAWLGLFENLALTAGFWIIVGSHTTAAPAGFGRILGANAVRAGRLAFAISLPMFGLSHFVYFEGAAGMVPAWIPWPGFWAAFTGAAHIAAGLSLLTNILSRLAAPLLGLMFTLFVLLLHLPRVINAPDNRIEWTMIFVATALTGAAWTVAGSLFRKAPG